MEGITSVKMLTWEGRLGRLVRGIRRREVAAIWRMLMIEAAAMAIMYFCVPVCARRSLRCGLCTRMHAVQPSSQ